MKTTRKRYGAEFKAKVAMEAIRGDLTLAELAAKHGVHHTMIGAWKRQAMDGMASLFDGGDQPLTLGAAAVAAGHVGDSPGLVDENEALGFEVDLSVEPALAFLASIWKR